MKIISDKRCIIGEGPIWNDKDKLLYFVNAPEKKICILDLNSETLKIRRVEKACSAICFENKNRLIVAREDGVFYLNDNDTVEPLYDLNKYKITNANDMKVGPDKRIYVGTISGAKIGVSDKIDGKLYSIDKSGKVKKLLDNIAVSNGLEWSIDEKFFYHTDSNTATIKEYAFDKYKGDITYTGRKIVVQNGGVDGFTIDNRNRLVVTRWDDKDVCFVDTKTMQIAEKIAVPNSNSASCSFAGENLDLLVVVTASYDGYGAGNENSGFVFVEKRNIGGRKP